MAWIEFHDDIWEHHKTERFADMIGVPVVYAVGHLGSLWHFVLRNAWKDANLEPWGDRGIERATRWVGEPGKMVKALRESGFLDGSVAHGWSERAGRLVLDRVYNEEKRKTKIYGEKHRKNGENPRKPLATQPNPTQPNPTIPNQKNSGFAKPTFEEVKAYCLERRNAVDPQQFVDYNDARGWMLGKNKMKDWKATIRTWERNQHGFSVKANTGSPVKTTAETGKYAGIEREV